MSSSTVKRLLQVLDNMPMAKHTKPYHDHGSQDIQLASSRILDSISMTKPAKPSPEHSFQDILNLQPLVMVNSQVMPKPTKPSHDQGSQEVHNLQPLETDSNMLMPKPSKPSKKIKERTKCDLSNMTTSNSSILVISVRNVGESIHSNHMWHYTGLQLTRTKNTKHHFSV